MHKYWDYCLGQIMVLMMERLSLGSKRNLNPSKVTNIGSNYFCNVNVIFQMYISSAIINQQNHPNVVI